MAQSYSQDEGVVASSILYVKDFHKRGTHAGEVKMAFGHFGSFPLGVLYPYTSLGLGSSIFIPFPSVKPLRKAQ